MLGGDSIGVGFGIGIGIEETAGYAAGGFDPDTDTDSDSEVGQPGGAMPNEALHQTGATKSGPASRVTGAAWDSLTRSERLPFLQPPASSLQPPASSLPSRIAGLHAPRSFVACLGNEIDARNRRFCPNA